MLISPNWISGATIGARFCVPASLIALCGDELVIGTWKRAFAHLQRGQWGRRDLRDFSSSLLDDKTLVSDRRISLLDLAIANFRGKLEM